jgi:hypothetical protein
MTKPTSDRTGAASGTHLLQWQRFWVPRTGGVIDLSDGGFLVDPTFHYAGRNSHGALQLEALADYRALALLGEPGIGKSTTLREEADRAAKVGPPGTVSIHVDLRAYSSESFLHKRVFESSEFLAWVNGSSHLVLHLDSLDEALLRIDSIANLLADELPRHPVARLSVRIASRTAVWPAATLETAFQRIWGEAAVGVFELAPLRRRDVVAAVEAAQIDPDDFFRELYSASAVPFAIKPLTLNLLISIFSKDGRLPRSVAELYFRGCLKLCEEQNPGRRDAGRVGSLTAAQRLRIASRIAATTMFANRYAVWTGPVSDGVPEEDLPLSMLAGQREDGDFPSFEITEQGVRETLDTGLFSSRGSHRMGWAHQGYAEFLAAQYLRAREVDPVNVLKLVVHPSGGLVPQLDVVTAWAASIGKDIREELMRREPMVLLQGDLSDWDEIDLGALTEALLTALDEGRAHDFAIGTSDFYTKLNHPGLASRLKPYILDAAKSDVSRRTAILIAERCGVKALQSELLALATDRGAHAYLRGRAVAALASCGDETVPATMLPFAKGHMGADPNDELKGYALRLLWPGHLTANELFVLLTPPNPGFVGAYVMFLTRTLPDTLKVADLPVALAWAKTFVGEASHDGDYQRRSLADSIFVLGWRNLDQSGIIEPLLDYVLARLRPSHNLFGGTGLREAQAFSEGLDADVDRRRRFLRAAAWRPPEQFDAYHLMRSHLLRRDDLQWLLEISPAAAHPDMALNADMVLAMIGAIVSLDDPPSFSAVYDAAARWPALWQMFRGVFEGIPLTSADARQMRDNFEMMKRFEERKPPPVTPPPAERVAELLDLFEAGDWKAWWRLNRELTLTPLSTHYGTDLEYAISRMPGWQEADTVTRQRILSGAAGYLGAGETSVPEWIGTTSLYFNDLAAFRALLLLREFDMPAYHALTVETWRKWTPAVVALPKMSGSEKAEFRSEVVADALAAAPVEFVQTVRELMKRERVKTAAAAAGQPPAPGTSFYLLREFEGCWDNEALKDGMFAELRDSTNTEDQFSAILDMLLKAKFVPARDLAVSLLETPGREHALAAAVSAATYWTPGAWPAVWKSVTADPDFAQTFFLRIAQHHRYGSSFFDVLDERQLAEIYVHLETIFPRSEDPQHASGLVHGVGPREQLADMRDRIPPQIAARGNTAAVDAVRWIVAKLPQQPWLTFRLLEAERTMRMKTWAPLPPGALLALLSYRDRVLVQSPEDLSELVVGALREFEKDLHGEQNPVRALWDRQQGGNTFRPVEEDAFSDSVRLFLRRLLVESGIVANREVEVARVPGAPVGRRTDIRIDALRRSAGGSYDVITAVIESKGCWNTALFGALNDQLYADYMMTLRAPVGIYLVGWFDKAKWDPDDRRRRQAPDLSIADAQQRLDAQAAVIPQGYLVKAVVIDCHAP